MLCNYTYIFLLKSFFFSQRQNMSICDHAAMHTRSHTVHSKHRHRGLRKGVSWVSLFRNKNNVGGILWFFIFFIFLMPPYLLRLTLTGPAISVSASVAVRAPSSLDSHRHQHLWTRDQFVCTAAKLAVAILIDTVTICWGKPGRDKRHIIRKLSLEHPVRIYISQAAQFLSNFTSTVQSYGAPPPSNFLNGTDAGNEGSEWTNINITPTSNLHRGTVK